MSSPWSVERERAHAAVHCPVCVGMPHAQHRSQHTHCLSDGVALCQRLRRWPNVTPLLTQCHQVDGNGLLIFHLARSSTRTAHQTWDVQPAVVHSLHRWPNIKSTLGQCVLLRTGQVVITSPLWHLTTPPGTIAVNTLTIELPVLPSFSHCAP